MRATRGLWSLGAVACLAAHASPWQPPGDETLRHDIELLADAGILRGPITTWPMSMPEIARDVRDTGNDAQLDVSTLAALIRVRRAAQVAATSSYTGVEVEIAGAYEPTPLRSFADSPREEGEARFEAGWLGNRLALNARVTVVADPDDDQPVRADGSYLGVNIGNFMVSAGYMERWWGPGWDGSLILSTNARPVPSLTIERNYSDPFSWRPLSWLGPWRASIAVGEAEASDVAIARVRFLAARVNFKPALWFEFGLTRTAQWCGDGRVCDWSAFQDLLVGRDNREDDAGADTEPGNQMAGYDLRVRSPWRALPLAAYAQWIGEDEAGGLPSKFLGLAGIEAWGTTGLGSLRVRAEFADTTCVFTRREPEFDCAYRNSLFPQGYTYRGRIIGHAMDNDSRMTSFAGLLVRPDGDSFGITLRRTQVNRDGGPHAISEVPLTVDNVELRYSRSLELAKLTIGVGVDDHKASTGAGLDMRGFVIWRQGF